MSTIDDSGCPLPCMEQAGCLEARMLGVLRIVACFVYIEHGTKKLFGLPHAGFPMSPVPQPNALPRADAGLPDR